MLKFGHFLLVLKEVMVQLTPQYFSQLFDKQ